MINLDFAKPKDKINYTLIDRIKLKKKNKNVELIICDLKQRKMYKLNRK